MDIIIEKGNLEYLIDCEETLLNSELGRKYFSGEGSGKKAILEGLEQGNLYVALINCVCVGFMWYIPKGAFHSFPYLHIISVKEEYRCKGIGEKLMNFLEEIVFLNANKLFLVVADFNPDAKRFYEKNGYRQVGEIPSLYRKGIIEYLMMKEKEM
ncbi:MAG: GNAT family N-acetyltransferase [Lachnospiraceae bacterium]